MDASSFPASRTSCLLFYKVSLHFQRRGLDIVVTPGDSWAHATSFSAIQYRLNTNLKDRKAERR